MELKSNESQKEFSTKQNDKDKDTGNNIVSEVALKKVSKELNPSIKKIMNDNILKIIIMAIIFALMEFSILKCIFSYYPCFFKLPSWIIFFYYSNEIANGLCMGILFIVSIYYAIVIVQFNILCSEEQQLDKSTCLDNDNVIYNDFLIYYISIIIFSMGFISFLSILFFVFEFGDFYCSVFILVIFDILYIRLYWNLHNIIRNHPKYTIECSKISTQYEKEKEIDIVFNLFLDSIKLKIGELLDNNMSKDDIIKFLWIHNQSLNKN